MKTYRYRLPYRAPLDWEWILHFYRYHLIEPIEKIDGGSFERVFELGGELRAFKVWREKPGVLNVELCAPSAKAHPFILDRLSAMFDLNTDPRTVARRLGRVPILHTLTRKYPGLRVASGWDPFEVAISTILGQLVSTTQARKLVGALTRLCGRPCKHPLSGELIHLFPDAETLATADLTSLGTTTKRKATIKTFATLVQEGELKLDGSTAPAELRRRLLAVPGIGRWSADYIDLRGLHDRGAFPATDLILKRALDKHPELLLEDVAPYQAYAAIYLWREYAESLSKRRKGHVGGKASV